MRKLSLRYLVPIFVLLGVAAGVLVYKGRIRPPGTSSEVTAPAVQQPKREVILYFGSPDGFSLVAEARDLPDGPEEQLVTEAVAALAQGADNELTPILPPGTRLLGYSAQDGVANLDFSRELVAAHPGGSMSELLTVYGLADTLAVNLPHIRKLRILVEGQPVETLKGHVDLRQPLAADFRFVRPSSGDAASNAQEH